MRCKEDVCYKVQCFIRKWQVIRVVEEVLCCVEYLRDVCLDGLHLEEAEDSL